MKYGSRDHKSLNNIAPNHAVKLGNGGYDKYTTHDYVENAVACIHSPDNPVSTVHVKCKTCNGACAAAQGKDVERNRIYRKAAIID